MENKEKHLENLANEKIDGEKIKGGRGKSFATVNEGTFMELGATEGGFHAGNGIEEPRQDGILPDQGLSNLEHKNVHQKKIG
ncbi:MAG: hypothetical protein ACI8ZN_002510 [Bacteroidia bacterium]|jgi:hypothetical protein